MPSSITSLLETVGRASRYIFQNWFNYQIYLKSLFVSGMEFKNSWFQQIIVRGELEKFTVAD